MTQKQRLAALRATAKRRDAVAAKLSEHVRAASAEGITLREIATAVGVTHPTVMKMIREGSQ